MAGYLQWLGIRGPPSPFRNPSCSPNSTKVPENGTLVETPSRVTMAPLLAPPPPPARPRLACGGDHLAHQLLRPAEGRRRLRGVRHLHAGEVEARTELLESGASNGLQASCGLPPALNGKLETALVVFFWRGGGGAPNLTHTQIQLDSSTLAARCMKDRGQLHVRRMIVRIVVPRCDFSCMRRSLVHPVHSRDLRKCGACFSTPPETGNCKKHPTQQRRTSIQELTLSSHANPALAVKCTEHPKMCRAFLRTSCACW